MDDQNKPATDNTPDDVPENSANPQSYSYADNVNEAPTQDNNVHENTEARADLTTPEIPAHAQKRSQVLPIILVVVLALILAAGAVYVFTKSSDTTKTTKTTTSTPTVTKATSTDVSGASEDVNKAVNDLNDAQDLNSSDLSDATLGL